MTTVILTANKSGAYHVEHVQVSSFEELQLELENFKASWNNWSTQMTYQIGTKINNI